MYLNCLMASKADLNLRPDIEEALEQLNIFPNFSQRANREI